MIEALGGMERWLVSHEALSLKVSFWVIALGFLACGWVGARTWWRIRNTIDESETGSTLKRQKLAEGVAWTMMGILFGTALIGAYELFMISTIGRNGMRLLAGIAVWLVAIFGLLFLRAFERDDALVAAKVDTRQDERETEQNLREVSQNKRDAEGVEPVNVRQDERETEQNVREKFQDDRDAVGSV